MQKLNLPEFSLRMRENHGVVSIFDRFRKKWVSLTPEEWVRQNFLHYLSDYKGFPPALMAVEKKVDINGLPQRFDLLVYDRAGQPLLLAEFKSPEVPIDQQAFNQVVRYNNFIRAPFVLVSNGISHYVSLISFSANSYEYLTDIPDFKAMSDKKSDFQ